MECLDALKMCGLKTHKGEPKDWNGWTSIETNDWNDWKLNKHRAESPIQPNCKLIILCNSSLYVRLIVMFN